MLKHVEIHAFSFYALMVNSQYANFENKRHEGSCTFTR
jgi:hypothetical protein